MDLPLLLGLGVCQNVPLHESHIENEPQTLGIVVFTPRNILAKPLFLQVYSARGTKGEQMGDQTLQGQRTLIMDAR